MARVLNKPELERALLSTSWNGSATYYRGIIRYLHERGHRITFYEPDACERQQHHDFPEPDWAQVVVYQPNEGEAGRVIAAASKTADVMMKTSGAGVLDELLEQAIVETKRPDNSPSSGMRGSAFSSSIPPNIGRRNLNSRSRKRPGKSTRPQLTAKA